MALRKFIIERDIPGAGSLEREQLRGAAAKSNGVLRELGPDIQWVESYVAADKTFCVYLAKDEAIINFSPSPALREREGPHAGGVGGSAARLTQFRLPSPLSCHRNPCDCVENRALGRCQLAKLRRRPAPANATEPNDCSTRNVTVTAI
jgi:hypothetical protein